MIVHVWRRAVEAGVGPVVVACAERAIADAVRAAGGEAVLTDPDLPSGTDRIYQALAALDPERRFDARVNLQGDLPTLDPARPRQRRSSRWTGSAPTWRPSPPPPRTRPSAPIPSVVKAVLACDPTTRGSAARSTSPAPRHPPAPGPVWHHIGIYAFTRAALERFAALPPSPLERRERLEQLRALENGMTIGVRAGRQRSRSASTRPADLERARRILETTA